MPVRRHRPAVPDGYFTQTIDGHGSSRSAHTVPSDPHDLPVVPALTTTGQHLTHRHRVSRAHAQGAGVDGPRRPYPPVPAGHQHAGEQRRRTVRITHQLYGGEREMRLQQELVLGVGGVRALRRAGPARHGLAHQRGPRGLPAAGALRDFDAPGPRCSTARWSWWPPARCSPRTRRCPRGTTFSTRPAGREVPGPAAAPMGLGVRAGLLALGLNPGRWSFNMTCLALRCTRFHNGVSRIHGQVASEMEARMWPQIPPEENPMTHVTNGVHLQTFLAREWVQPVRPALRRLAQRTAERGVLGAPGARYPTTSTGACTRR